MRLENRFFLLLGLTAAGCAPSAPPADVPPALQHIAEVHKARCGNCHVRVEPGARQREQLEAAFPKHRSRVHLSDEEWAQMIEYLSAPAPSMPPLRGDKEG